MPFGPNTKIAPLNFNASGDTSVITAPASGPILVYGIIFTVGGATNITFKNGAIAQSGPIIFTANGSSMNQPVNNYPVYWADPGNDFIMNSSNAVQISGSIYYASGG